VADIVAADDGDGCSVCGSPLRTERGVEVGNIFKLGTRFADAFEATYLDPDGNSKPIVMGSYGIGVGRLLACIAEEHHDERGLRLPVAIAPYPVHLTVLRGSDSAAGEVAERVYGSLEASGIGVLLRRSSERPGVQFADADLIGLPVRLTVSERSLKAGRHRAEAPRRGRRLELLRRTPWFSSFEPSLTPRTEAGPQRSRSGSSA